MSPSLLSFLFYMLGLRNFMVFYPKQSWEGGMRSKCSRPLSPASYCVVKNGLKAHTRFLPLRWPLHPGRPERLTETVSMPIFCIFLLRNQSTTASPGPGGKVRGCLCIRSLFSCNHHPLTERAWPCPSCLHPLEPSSSSLSLGNFFSPIIP